MNEAELKQDIDYIFHVEHELPMEWYTQLEAVKADLVRNVIVHVEAETKRRTQGLKDELSRRLTKNIATMILEIEDER